jgi:hypothetical protein
MERHSVATAAGAVRGLAHGEQIGSLLHATSEVDASVPTPDCPPHPEWKVTKAMDRICDDCQTPYDDAVRSTLCPHPRLLTEAAQARKDLALSLLGHELHWAHMPEGPALTIESVGWDGMVTLRGWPGEFAPHLFRRVS